MVVMVTPVAFENIGYRTYVIFAVINFFMFPAVYFFFPETRYRSLEEMDEIFKKSSSIFDAPWISIKEPYRYDKHGHIKSEYIEEAIRRQSEPKPDISHSEENDSDQATSGNNTEVKVEQPKA